MFHSAGMVFCFAIPFFYELSVVFGPASVPVNLNLINSIFDAIKVDGSLLAPSTLEGISKDQLSLDRIAKTKFTFFGGGPLSQECGDQINTHIRVFNIVGVTEGSLFPIVQAKREDWNYLHFHPAAGLTYRQRTDELREQFQTRDPKLDLFQAFLQTFPDQDVKFLQVDHSKPKFGLTEEIFEELVHGTTHIIHNQWQVDFNLSLLSFEPHIRGIRHLVDFSIQGSRNPAIFFISSVGVVKNQQTNATVLEAPVIDFSTAEGGYGSSKLVSEWVLDKANTISAVTCSMCRLGQIAGPVDMHSGMWNRQEWLPSIIASSKYLGMIPSTLSSLDRVDWLPVNHTSKIVLELAGLYGLEDLAAPFSSVRFFHGVNPAVTSWSSLLPAITSAFGPEVSVVPWENWISTLEASVQKGDLDQNPGIKLIDFYRNIDKAGSSGLELPILETKMTQWRSETLRTLGPVKESWTSQWMNQWNF